MGDAKKRCGGYRNDVRDATTRMAIGYGVGAGLAVTTVLLFILEGETPSEHASSGCTLGVGTASCIARF
jgi:hypothetical protein